jgi:hypothetical protein
MFLIDKEDVATVWRHLDDGSPKELAGSWLIIGRVREGELQKMQPGARRTN